MRVLLTGAGGFVGRHLAPRLREAGHEVVPLRREGGSQAGWHGPRDLRALADVTDWPAGIDAVVHLAALNPARGDKSATDLAALRAVNVDGTRALAARCVREGVSRLVFLSSANVHAASGGATAVRESDPIAPQTPYARTKAEAEAALHETLAGTGTASVVLRPAPVFGAGGRGTVALLAKLAATPLPLPLRRLNGRRSLLAVSDLAEAIRLALVEPAAAGSTLLLSGGSATPAAIAMALREGFGRSPRLLPLPTRAMGVLAGLLGKRDAWNNLTGDFVVDAAQAHATLGWAPGATLSERLAEAAREIARHERA